MDSNNSSMGKGRRKHSAEADGNTPQQDTEVQECAQPILVLEGSKRAKVWPARSPEEEGRGSAFSKYMNKTQC